MEVNKTNSFLEDESPTLNIKIGDHTIGNDKYEKLLGVKIDVKLNFNYHISDLCKKANRKKSTLGRVAVTVLFLPAHEFILFIFFMVASLPCLWSSLLCWLHASPHQTTTFGLHELGTSVRQLLGCSYQINIR